MQICQYKEECVFVVFQQRLYGFFPASSKKKAEELADRQRREAEKAAVRESQKQKMIDIMEAKFLEDKEAAEERIKKSIRDAEDKQQVL